jgi:hypothetical protein
MSGFLALGVAAYFLFKANKAMEEGDDFTALVKIIIGMVILSIGALIFL